jgi:hypothetical protein
MALRDWTFRRILGFWTGWMSGLLLLLLIAVILSPTGLQIAVSPPGLPLLGRIVLGLLGVFVACLPPALLTFAWYFTGRHPRSQGRMTSGTRGDLADDVQQLRVELSELQERFDMAEQILARLSHAPRAPRIPDSVDKTNQP